MAKQFVITNEKRRKAARELWQGMDCLVRFVSRHKGKAIPIDELSKMISTSCDLLDRNVWTKFDVNPLED